MNFNDAIKKIEKYDENYYLNAKNREDNLIKPPHSMGALEEIACRICAITKSQSPRLEKKRLIVFASDNGVFNEKVSSCPQNITIDQTINLTRSITGASSMARYFNDDVVVYDVGVNNDIDKYVLNFNKKYNLDIKNKVINKKVNYGTKNIMIEPAMSFDEMMKAINVGFEAIDKSKDEGVDIVGVGEMGICNTTTSSSILSLLSGEPALNITGRGAGLTDEYYNNKINVVEKSVCRAFSDFEKKFIIDNIFKKFNDDTENMLYKILQELGGFDICSMVGAYIGAAYNKIPIVVDGFIGIVSALIAVALNNNIKDYLFTSHESMEPGYKVASKILNIKPMFNLDMRLGEGSGCIIAFRIIDSALAMHNNMKTFTDVNIDDSYLNDIR